MDEKVTFCGYDIDPSVYKDLHIYKNATVILSENLDTGEIVVSWMKQKNTEEVDQYPVDE